MYGKTLHPNFSCMWRTRSRNNLVNHSTERRKGELYHDKTPLVAEDEIVACSITTGARAEVINRTAVYGAHVSRCAHV